jgi:hypothetical protein
MRIKNQAKVSRQLINDIKSVCGSIYTLNAPNAIGYAFHERADGKAIAVGMFINNSDNIKNWTYFLEYKTSILSKVN